MDDTLNSISAKLLKPQSYYTTTQIILISIVASLLSIITVVGNLMVIISFKIDKKLQTISNYFLFSLAVADVAIGLISMPLFAMSSAMGYWPLGPQICDAWLSLDYVVSNASVLNLLIICFDRYFSVTRPLTYRANRTTNCAAFMIGSVWCISLLLWLPWIYLWPYIDGKRTVPNNKCYVQFTKTNLYMTFSTAIASFYVPLTIMCFLYWRIWQETEKRQKGLSNLQAWSKDSNTQYSHSSEISYYNSGAKCICKAMDSEERGRVQSTSGIHTLSDGEMAHLSQIIYCDLCKQKGLDNYSPLSVVAEESDHIPGLVPHCVMVSNNINNNLNLCIHHGQCIARHRLSPNFYQIQKPINSNLSSVQQKLVTVPTNLSSDTTQNLSKKKKIRKRKKAIRTLSKILLTFILTWTPYNILVLMKPLHACSGCIPSNMWNFFYFLRYINSTINPVCFALSNKKFRLTYLQLLTCKWQVKNNLSSGFH